MQLQFDVVGELDVRARLELLKMPPAMRKRMMGKLARKVRTSSRKRIRQQQGLDGQPWEKRKGRGRKKMLRGLSKRMVTYYSPDKATVTFNNGGAGRIAREHQEGTAEVMTKAKLAKMRGREYQANQAATRSQAKALIESGFKARKDSGKGYKKPSIKWIVSNMSMAQAGMIYRLIRDDAAKESWVIKLPARSFLGLTEKERREHTWAAYREALLESRARRQAR